jgi:ferredoxin-NADP reductase
MQRLEWQTATITAIVPQTPRIKSFFFKRSQPFPFQAGQHVDVRLTAEDGYQAERSYSIASAPGSDDTIELAIELLGNGEVSPFFHEVAQVGDEIELRGPIGGYFVWSPADQGPVVFVGGGSGVAPLASMVRHRHAANSRAPMRLLLSARTWEDLLFRNEMLERQRGNTDFQFITMVTRTPHPDANYSRRIDSAMIDPVLASLPSPPTHIYVCGSNPFVETASQALIQSGIPAELIRTERYGG